MSDLRDLQARGRMPTNQGATLGEAFDRIRKLENLFLTLSGGGGGGGGAGGMGPYAIVRGFGVDMDPTDSFWAQYVPVSTSFETNDDGSMFTDAGDGSINVLEPGVYLVFGTGFGLPDDGVFSVQALGGAGDGTSAGSGGSGDLLADWEWPLVGLMGDSIASIVPGTIDHMPGIQKDYGVYEITADDITAGIKLGAGLLVPTGWGSGGEKGCTVIAIRVDAAIATGHVDLGLLLADGSDIVGLNLGQSGPSPSATDTVAITVSGTIQALTTAWNFTMPVTNNTGVAIEERVTTQLSVQDMTSGTDIAFYDCAMPPLAVGATDYITVTALNTGTDTIDFSAPANPIFLAAHKYAVTLTIAIKQS